MARDERGRYISLKEICDNGPAHARGCPKCKFGIVSAPELLGVVPIYLERMVQAMDKDITFCDCQAGKHYYVSLRNRHQEIVEQARQDLKVSAKLKVDNPIDIARAAMRAEQAKRTPTIHLSQEPELA